MRGYMPKTLLVESFSATKPLFLLCGVAHPLFKHYFSSLDEKFNFLLVADDTVHFSGSRSEIHRIGTSSAYLLNKIAEHIDYALVFLDKHSKTSLWHIIRKAEKNHARTVVVLSWRDVWEQKDLLSELSNNKNVYFLIAGDLIDSKKGPETQISKLVFSALHGETIQLQGDELVPVFALSSHDLIQGINYLLFGKERKHFFYNLYYKEPSTLLAAIHLLRRTEPGLDIRFSEQGSSSPEYRQDLEANFFLNPNIKPAFIDLHLAGFESSVKLLQEVEGNTKVLHAKTRLLLKHAKKRVLWFHEFLTPLILSAILYVSLSTIFLIYAMVAYYTSFQRLEKTGSVSYKNIQTAHALFSLARPLVDTLKYSIKMVDSRNPLLGSIETMEMADTLVSDNLWLLKADKLHTLSLSRMNRLLASLFWAYSLGQKEKAENKNTFLSRFIHVTQSKFLTIGPVLPELLGFYSSKQYLILFENTAELRPNGGFIGSIGEATIEKARLKTFNVQDVYDIDGQLKAHVEPPFAVRRYLQPHLFLRDSNFYLDFQESARKAALLYGLSQKKNVDGIIAVDFSVLKTLLQILGPIKLHDYNITLTEENVLSFLQDTIEKNFFPGSRQKKELLTKLFNQITLRFEENPLYYYKALGLLPQLLLEKHILVSFPESHLQKIFSINNFSGEFSDTRASENSINDLLYINEANIGANKVNSNISRTIAYEAVLNLRGIESKATIDFVNSSKDAQVYKTYLRIVTPLKSQLTSIKINGLEQSLVPAVTDFNEYERPGFTPPSGLEVERTIEDGKQIFGFVVAVPARLKQHIEVSYINGLNFTSASFFSYSLLFIKQPGTDAYPLQIRIRYPSLYTPRHVQATSLEKNTIEVNELLRTDKEFSATFQKS